MHVGQPRFEDRKLTRLLLDLLRIDLWAAFRFLRADAYTFSRWLWILRLLGKICTHNFWWIMVYCYCFIASGYYIYFGCHDHGTGSHRSSLFSNGLLIWCCQSVRLPSCLDPLTKLSFSRVIMDNWAMASESFEAVLVSREALLSSGTRSLQLKTDPTSFSLNSS